MRGSFCVIEYAKKVATTAKIAKIIMGDTV
jgi:hypothetical protein